MNLHKINDGQMTADQILVQAYLERHFTAFEFEMENDVLMERRRHRNATVTDWATVNMNYWLNNGPMEDHP